MPTSLFRTLDANETIVFRKWARDNFTPGSEINSIWHPVIQVECEMMDIEATEGLNPPS